MGKSASRAPTMSFVMAAEEVLRLEGRDMTAAEIVERAIDLGLISSQGRTPVATMGARLYTAARRPCVTVVRVAVEGRLRAVKGSVRWRLKGR